MKTRNAGDRPQRSDLAGGSERLSRRHLLVVGLGTAIALPALGTELRAPVTGDVGHGGDAEAARRERLKRILERHGPELGLEG